MKEHYYSIGEMAKLTNLSIQTLRYYDQIDLFKPAYTDPVTNYRYYHESQFYYLDLIKSLKYVGTPLDTIKQVQNYPLEELVTFLSKQEQVIESSIQRLQEVQYTLLKTKKQLEEQLAIPSLNEVYEKMEEDIRVLYIRVHNATPKYIPHTYFSELIKTIENEGSVITSRYGCTYQFKPYQSIEEIDYQNIFTPILTSRFLHDLSGEMDVMKIKAGRYVCIAFIFSLEKYIEHYKTLYAYIEANQLLVESDVYEFYMPTHYAPTKEEQYVVELKVKLKDQSVDSIATRGFMV
ncbi:MerR family transcriptional regulator [Lysinibacillus sp. LZ02]|uniref:MerR family transcriptional regulator n=1 Tax=Lysinibacillus sp. LZ02 TaxID=3420668 RepID=UPI003D36E18F